MHLIKEKENESVSSVLSGFQTVWWVFSLGFDHLGSCLCHLDGFDENQ